MNWPASGTYRFDTKKSLVKVFTFKVPGLISAVAHDLEFHSNQVSGSVEVGEDSATVTFQADLWNLEIHEPLTGLQKSEAEKTMRKKVLKKKDKATAVFKGTVAKGASTATGRLSLIGGPEKDVSLDLSVDVSDETFTVTLRKTLMQTEFGITPYKAMMGMLKLEDRIEVHVSAVLVGS